MNKKVFTALVILMGISILGIIGVQLVWMNNALKVKNELFERGVTDALNNTIIHLEKIHDLRIVNEMVFNDSILWVRKNAPKHSRNIITKKHFTNKKKPITIIREYGNSNGKTTTIEVKIDSTNSNTFQYQYNSNISKKDKNNRIHIDENHFLFSDELDQDIFLLKDTLRGDVDSIYSMGVILIDSIETNLDSIAVVVPEFTKRVRLKANKLKNIANQVVTEVSAWDVYDVDYDQINNVLKQELANQNIDIEFIYGVIKDSEISKNNTTADSLKLLHSTFQASLYPNNIFQKDIVLSLYFPRQENFIYQSINWLLIASFIFSMIILVTFALSIFYIIRQKKISEMKSDFINNMTHEFKTPIATISVAADSISNEKVVRDPERIKYFAGMIKKENLRMNRQVEDILTIARLDKKEFEFNWEPINVHDLIEDAIEGINIQAEKRNGKIKTVFIAPNPVATTDKFHCTNIIYNLLDNAIKYSTKNPDIIISTYNTPKGLLISVKDNGIGMNNMVQSKIFERFYRQASGNIHNVKGFGLGLSYVKAVTEANHGKITVKSEPEKGSEFIVFLPFTRQ